MSSFIGRAPRAFLLPFLIAVAALPAVARADAALDLVRSVAAERLPSPPANTCKGQKRRPARAARFVHARRVRPPVRAARPAPLRLTPAQRGSGRVQVLVVADDSATPSALPSVERKSDRVRPIANRR